ncbi:MAG: two component transcriptional regulator, winged helix family [Ignavibacteria bacterium]|nr:two component transcriptional regulator, winged helix family [Ignavibacteria bacterium]
MRILIVEDDEKIRNALSKGLTSQHYSVDSASNGKQGEYLAKTNDYDVIILDIMLPGKDGMEVCREIRTEGIKTPILMLTALDSYENKIKGLDEGADDYLTKPFHFGELLARVRSLVRRNSEQKTSQIQIADLIMDTTTRNVVRAGKTIHLSAKEFALLEYFIMNKNKVLTREMISEHVWDMNFDPQSNVIDSFVRFLRQKIDKGFAKPLIQTLRGVGYKLSE